MSYGISRTTRRKCTWAPAWSGRKSIFFLKYFMQITENTYNHKNFTENILDCIETPNYSNMKNFDGEFEQKKKIS